MYGLFLSFTNLNYTLLPYGAYNSFVNFFFIS